VTLSYGNIWHFLYCNIVCHSMAHHPYFLLHSNPYIPCLPPLLLLSPPTLFWLAQCFLWSETLSLSAVQLTSCFGPNLFVLICLLNLNTLDLVGRGARIGWLLTRPHRYIHTWIFNLLCSEVTLLDYDLDCSLYHYYYYFHWNSAIIIIIIIIIIIVIIIII
jgi:hypothetical protein